VILRIIVESFAKWRSAADVEARLVFDAGGRRPTAEPVPADISGKLALPRAPQVSRVD